MVNIEAPNWSKSWVQIMLSVQLWMDHLCKPPTIQDKRDAEELVDDSRAVTCQLLHMGRLLECISSWKLQFPCRGSLQEQVSWYSFLDWVGVHETPPLLEELLTTGSYWMNKSHSWEMAAGRWLIPQKMTTYSQAYSLHLLNLGLLIIIKKKEDMNFGRIEWEAIGRFGGR